MRIQIVESDAGVTESQFYIMLSHTYVEFELLYLLRWIASNCNFTDEA